MSYTIYLRTNKVNGKQYVGQTKDFKKRENSWRCLKARYANWYITGDREKYGLDNFNVVIIDHCETQKEAYELEQKYINELGTKYPDGYNFADGGKTSKGTKYRKEVKQKMSESQKGKHNSPDTEFKKGMTPWIKGKKHSKEANEKNRQAHLGKISKKRKPVLQLTLDGDVIREFTHCEEAAQEMGFKSDESIRKACKESWRTSGGFKWKYAEDC